MLLCLLAVMEVSSQDPPLKAMDLSKSYSVTPLTRSHTEAMDLAKKPEWYHRRPVSCSTEISSPFRSRASSSYNSLSTRLHPEPAAPVHCRDLEQRPESLGNYMNSTLTRGLDLYRDRVHGNLWHTGFYGTERTSSPAPESSGGEETDSGSDVIFLVSSAKEPLLCTPFVQDGVGHIVEPLSPAVSSLDEGRGCYHLPQPLSSPSHDSSYSEDSSDSSVDIPVHHARPVVLLSDLSAVYGDHAESPVDISSDDSDVIEVSVTHENRKNNSCKRERERESPPQIDEEKAPATEVRRSRRIRKSVSEMSPFSCSASRHSLKRRAKNDAVGIYNESCDSDDMLEYAVRLSSSDADEPASPPKVLQRGNSKSSEESGVQMGMDRKAPQRESQPQSKVSQTKCRTQSKTLAIQKATKTRKAGHKQKSKAPTEQRQSSKSANATRTARRKKKRCLQKGLSVRRFPAREPEIQLKYANLKEAKKERKPDSFCPFIHMDRRTCTIINYQEEAATVRSSMGGQQQTGSRSLSSFVPNSSCFQLGRSSSESQCEATLLCCLCGHTANAVGLGDLHGPYHPVSPSVDCQSQNCRTEQRDKECSGSGNSLHDGCDGSVDGCFCESNNVSLRLHECWIHEDCGIWSAGVFLVRGKLYGLEEAARLAQQTVSLSRKTVLISGAPRRQSVVWNVCEHLSRLS